MTVKTPPWPDFSIDQQACKQAFAELGNQASLSAVMDRAQQIKIELKKQQERKRRA
jgi:hypothetical protein